MSISTKPLPNLLIVDDDDTVQRLLTIAARDQGWLPEVCSTGDAAMKALHSGIEAVILDLNLPGMSGMEILTEIQRISPGLPVIMLTGVNEAETAVMALKAGAMDYLTKPFELKRLFGLLDRAKRSRHNAMAAESKVLESSRPKPGIRTLNRSFRGLLDHMAKAARLDCTILLTGESGTGKTHFAKEIHRLSPRASGQFVTVSCPALPKDLLESELFGHEKGAFTGATGAKAGRFELASTGTLFLDEVGDLPPSLQPKLLTVLQDREFFRVGGTKALKTGARVIAATNVNLRERVELGSFREDLYYRLNIIELRIPPLRERKEDIPALVSEFLAKIAKSRGSSKAWTVKPQGMKSLMDFDWPGNIRQLQNVIERATAFADQCELGEMDIRPILEAQAVDASQRGAADFAGMTLEEIERNAFIQTYLRAGKNKARTARDLGISERSVYNLLERHGLK